jgi:hypothetical protein
MVAKLQSDLYFHPIYRANISRPIELLPAGRRNILLRESRKNDLRHLLHWLGQTYNIQNLRYSRINMAYNIRFSGFGATQIMER